MAVGRAVVALLACAGSLALAGCSSEGSAANASASAPSASTDVPATASAAPAAIFVDPATSEACAAKRAEIQKEKAAPGAPKVSEQAIQFARVRSRPMLWLRQPSVPAAIEKLEKKELSSIGTMRAMKEIVSKKGDADNRREQVLSDGGYLFADDPIIALALIEQVSLTRIFDEKTIFLQRGTDVYELAWARGTKLDKERYVYKDGPDEGEKAEILFGDRVAKTREELESQPTAVVDLGELMNRSDFDRVRPIHLTEQALVADVRYGTDTWVPALFRITGAKLELSCEVLTSELATKKAKFVAEHEVYRKALARLRAVVRKMVKERIPFDAGDGQKNGYLRKAWERAYLAGWRVFNYEGDKHDVYTLKGDPMPPQVCIDFQLDVWERAAGTWYTPMTGDPLAPAPKRLVGGIEMEALKIDNLRSVAEFVEGAKQHKELFDVLEIPQSEKIPFKKRDEFYQYMSDKQDNFRPGDMITVFGMKNGHPHYHSLMITEQDPVTGVPRLVAGNAVFPREQSLEGILQISPKRSLKHRVRMKEPWLKIVAETTSPI